MKKLSLCVLFVSFTAAAGVFADGEEHVIEWSALRSLDMAAERAEAYGEKSSTRWREVMSALKASSQSILTNGVPDGVKNRRVVNLLMADLADLSALIAEPENMSLDDMKMAAEAFHPLVATIMHEAGIPHIHDHDEHDHADHHDHDYDDDHGHDHLDKHEDCGHEHESNGHAHE